MAITVGSRLGPYEIVAPLGAGGMGEVYRARDTKLNRDVAIEVLLSSVAHDADRLSRFDREAQLLAALNHPNIAHIHGLEESGGVQALVMELVEGPTLADRIAHGAIPVDEALPIARQIAEALEAAHSQGIVHRDLKPANIKVRPDGTVKVLDFGLAKALDPLGERGADAAISPTLSLHATQSGVILGTAAYMSPEQARGKAVDARTDIWSFGCVLYEMLCAHRAFEGASVTDALAAVMLKDPDWSRLPPEVPPSIARLLSRTLQKDPVRRFRDIGDAGLDIHDALAEVGARPAVPPPDSRRSIVRVVWPVLVAVIVLVASMALWSWRPSGTAAVTKVIIGWRDGAPARGVVAGFALAPDGSRLVYLGRDGQLWLRDLADLEPRALAGTSGANLAFFSPDSQSVAFVARSEGSLKVMPLHGGSVRTLVPRQVEILGGDWTSDGMIYFSRPTEGVWKIPETGGTAEPVSRPRDVGVTHAWVDVLPNRNGAVLTIKQESANTSMIGVLEFATGRLESLFPGVQAKFVTSGHLIYVTADGRLHAAPFDQGGLKVTGSAVPLIENVSVELYNSGARFAISDNGTLVYEIQSQPRFELVWVTKSGAAEKIALEAWEADFFSLSLSPDAKRVAVAVTVGTRQDVWTRSLETGALNRLTFDQDGSLNYRAKWTADGRALAFISNRAGTAGDLWRQAADGSTPAERLVSDGPIIDEGFISPDGRWAVYRSGGSGLRGRDIKGVRLGDGEDPAPRALVATPADEYGPALSPDGRWLAYVSDASGRAEVYVRPFPATESAVWQVSTGGGRGPLWARSGQQLFFENARAELIGVETRSGSAFTWTSPQRLFSLAGFKLNAWQPTYDVAPDGQRFLMARPVGDPSPELVLTLNWFEELKAKLP